jgi:hypothetical protein
MEATTTQLADAFTWVRRQQAFAVIAGKCSLARVQCLKEIKHSKAYEELGLNWEEFCKQHAGISRLQADSLIQQLDQLGENYFRLSELARISPETYREIESHVHDSFIELNGELVPLIPNNAPRIRAAIQSLRRELKQERENRLSHPVIAHLGHCLESLLSEFESLDAKLNPNIQNEGIALRGLIHDAIERFARLSLRHGKRV